MSLRSISLRSLKRRAWNHERQQPVCIPWATSILWARGSLNRQPQGTCRWGLMETGVPRYSVPDWMVPQALKLGSNPLQCFKLFCAVLLATGKGPRDPFSYWAVVNSIVSIVYSPIYSTAKGRIIHTSWKDRGGEKWVEMSVQLPGFSLSLKDLTFSPALEQAPWGWMAGTAGRTCGCQEGHQVRAEAEEPVSMQKPDPKPWSGPRASGHLLLSLA